MKHGRRRTLAYVTLPFAASWTLTMFASCVEMIYLTAFLVGFFSAIVQLATQVRQEERSQNWGINGEDNGKEGNLYLHNKEIPEEDAVTFLDFRTCPTFVVASHALPLFL